MGRNGLYRTQNEKFCANRRRRRTGRFEPRQAGKRRDEMGRRG